MKLVSLMAFALMVIPAAAQTVNSKDCLAYKLLSTQPDSIIVQFNAKIIRLLVTPETEIWRRGVDLTSPLELSADDNVYVKCADEPAPDGTPIATIIAAAHENTGVSLEPHHIAEIPACLGRLVDIGAFTITVKNDDGLCTVVVPAGIDIWRGERYHDTSVLRLGDEVGVRARISYPSGQLVARDVEANVAKTEGTIISVQPDRIVVKDSRRFRTTVLLDSRTKCDECAPADLKKGVGVLATGLQLSHNQFRATYITVEK
jgi:hypothetical protein